jgi:hypothetical protein
MFADEPNQLSIQSLWLILIIDRIHWSHVNDEAAAQEAEFETIMIPSAKF